jgi:hypothetical protein
MGSLPVAFRAGPTGIGVGRRGGLGLRALGQHWTAGPLRVTADAVRLDDARPGSPEADHGGCGVQSGDGRVPQAIGRHGAGVPEGAVLGQVTIRAGRGFPVAAPLPGGELSLHLVAAGTGHGFDAQGWIGYGGAQGEAK